LDEVVLLSEAIRAETRGMAIRLNADNATPAHVERLGDVLRQSPGGCPVQLIIETEDGAEAVLTLRSELRVEPSDSMLASLERLFGRSVAELR
jgi:DNA polymerase-3 subunit alpha